MIQWREGLSVGVQVIDDDHKQLIGIINEFLELSRTRAPAAKALKAIADRLLYYANAHFEREERLQLLAHYEAYDGHKKRHNGLLDSLEELIERHLSDESSIDGSVVQEMDSFLRVWLIDHILKCDVMMRGKLEPKG